LDAVAALAIATCHAFRLGLDRLRPRASGLPRSLDDLDARFVAEALGAPVARIERLDRQHGTTSRARIALHPSRDAPSPPRIPPRRSEDLRIPATVFAKLPARRFVEAWFGSMLALGGNEVRFYREVAPEVPVPVPHAHFAASSSDGARFVLLLEDLVGCRFRTIADGCDLREARAVLSELARLHARFWESEQLDGRLAWLPRRGAEPSEPVARWICRLAFARALRRHGEAVSERIARAAPRILALRDVLERAWAAPPRTLIHGDPHLGNLYFRRDGRVGFVDWQVGRCGQGMRDVTHFLVSSLPVVLRRAHQDELLAHYVACLADAGIGGFGIREARQQFRLHACYGWLAATVTAAAGSLQSQAVCAAAMERAGAVLEDERALEALENLASG
jgi:aminoglycoside phosphotransferase (APT) family kinase protein